MRFPSEEPPPEAPSTTPTGLPVRVPQASLARPLRDEPTAEPVADEDGEGRSPEEIRKILGAFQSGARRGRDEAAAGPQTRDQADDQ